MEFKGEVLDSKTCNMLGSLILSYFDLSKRQGRPEQFLSGLSVAYSLVTGADLSDRDLSDDNQLELFL